MDYNEREAQRRQEDRDLNRALIWVGAAVVLEFLLSLINKYYINFRTTPESINLALAISAALNGLRWVSLAALAACVVWVVLRLKQGGRAGLQLSLAAVSAALYLCAQITLVFQESGIRMLFWLVPAWAALALVYYLYQREFFLSALVSGVGVLGLWFVRHAGASSFYTIGAVAVILVLAPEAKEKVLELARLLTPYTGRLTVHVVPFTAIQEELRRSCPEELFTIIMRRFMMRISQAVAKRCGAKALVTGECLGQVASQTMDAMLVTGSVVELPILRPCIGMDKEEIVQIARKIGTFETSILPYEDCCTVFTPRHPRLRPMPGEVEAAEQALDIEAMVQAAVDGIERLQVNL